MIWKIDKNNFIKQTKYKYLKKIKLSISFHMQDFLEEKLKRDEIYIKFNF